MRFADGLYPEHAFRVVGGRMTYEGGGKGSAPPPPDYAGAAREQGQQSKEITNMQNFANRPNQTTPWGGTTWSTQAVTDPATGQQVTQWNQNLEVAPQAQEALDSQMALQSGRSRLAESMLPRARQEVSNPWDFSQFTTRKGISGETTQAGTPEAFVQDRQRIENAMFDRMRPEHQFQNEALRTQLSNQGITEGSEAYDRAQRQQADLQARERFNALEIGGNEQQRMQSAQLAREGQAFGQDVTDANFTNNLRQQEIAEEMQRRGMSLNEINALITGQQVQTPQMPGFVTAQRADPAQLLQATQLQGQYGLDAYNAKQMGAQGMMSGLFGLGNTGLTYALGGFG